MKRDGLLSIQCLRGVAAFLVVMQHAIGGFHLKFPLQSGLLLSAGYLEDLGASGVDIFFVISGFIMVYVSRFRFGSSVAILDFLVRRAIRIVPLYWTVTLLMLLLLLFAPTLFSTMRFDLAQTVKSFLFIPTVNSVGDYYPIVGAGWTLSYEVYFYIIFSLSLILPAGLSVLLCALYFSVSIMAGIFFEPRGPIAELVTNQLLLEFFAGQCIGLWFIKGGELKRIVAVAVLAIALVIYTMHVFRGPATGERFIDRGLPAVAVVLSLLSMERNISFPQWLKSLGDSSYSLYLTHTFVVTAFYKSLESLGLLKPLPADVVILLALGGAVVGAHAVFLGFERPLTRILIQSWERRRRSDKPKQKRLIASDENQPRHAG